MSRPGTDGGLMAAFIQGGLLQASYVLCANLTQPATVEQHSEPDGTYEPFFHINLASGIVLRVSIDIVQDVVSEPD